MIPQIIRIPVGIIGTNCYIYRENNDSTCWIIDPGGESSKIIQSLHDEGLTPKGILLTHTHFDHILGLTGLIEEYGKTLPVFVHVNGKLSLGKSGGEKQKKVLLMMSQSLADENSEILANLPDPTNIFYENSEIGQQAQVPESSLSVIQTPGHAPESVCYFSAEFGILFSGDTLFRQSIGRSDFQGGSSEDLFNSISQNLYTLPENTIVYPGHGESTTIGYEKVHNPFITG
ncbi:MAG: MBL fold metallo-hydrolase [Bacteroidetes bacterium]|nr:MBL fold metallo-hydrolase [Bacteroidota bacterium]